MSAEGAPGEVDPTKWAQTVVRVDSSGIPSRLHFPRPAGLSELLDAVTFWPRRPAVVQGAQRVTFSEFLGRTQVVARLLYERGVRPGDRVAILGRNSVPWLEVLWATQRLHAVAVPLNGWWAARELQHSLALTTPRLVWVDDEWVDRLPEDIDRLTRSEVEREEDTRQHGQPPWEDGRSRSEDDPAMVIFTSGTTGLPRGAEMSHRALVSTQLSMMAATGRLPGRYEQSPNPTKSIVAGPLFHTAALQMHLTTWMVGGTVILLRRRFDPGEVLEIISQEAVTTFSGVPTMMTRMLEHPLTKSLDLSSLRSVGLGGAPVSHRLIERVGTVFPAAAMRVSNTYGLTETGGAVTVSSGRDVVARPGTSGRAFPLVDLTLADPDPEGVGELCVKAPSQMTRYVGTDETPIDEDGWVHTGDLARIDPEGFLFIVGRLKDVVIRGGENISAPAVEAVLASHASVAEVAVVGLPDEDFGEVVAAIVVARRGVTASQSELAKFAGERLAHFAVPGRWWFHSGPLPTNEPGKVDKRLLRCTFPTHEVTV